MRSRLHWLLLCSAFIAPSLWAKSWVIPHVLEKEGLVTDSGHTFDTSLFITYTGGLAGTKSSNKTGAVVELYLYSDKGSELMKSATGNDVCNPCTITLSDARRKESVRIDDLITRSGGFSSKEMSGYAVIVVGGEDPKGVNIQGFVVNAHTSPLDLSVFGFEPQPIAVSN